MKSLLLPPEIRNEIAGQAECALPYEAVGLIGGFAEGYATVVLPLPNVAGSGEFLADPFAQFQAERRLRDSGLRLLAIYHSHPGGSVLPSSADLAFGERWPCAHVIVALGCPCRPGIQINAYRFAAGGFVEVQIRTFGSL